MKISVVGCGCLGAVHAASMAELGHEVVGVDVDGRNALDGDAWEAAGSAYRALGRRAG